jgi:8-oxo-dGTP diphosphatase
MVKFKGNVEFFNEKGYHRGMIISNKYTPIIGTLGYVLSPDGSKVLMIHRNKKKGDDHLGKYNGLGGKMDRDEDVFSSMAREIYEEAGITPLQMTLRGTINWTGFGKNGEDWLGFIFLIKSYSGEAKTSCEEGDLEWVVKDEILKLPLWEGDRHFLPLVFDEEKAPFHGIMPYKGEKMLSFSTYKASK